MLTCAHGLLREQGKRLVDAWYSLQLSHYGGKYSIERILSLEEYTRSMSLLRVVLVSVSVPLLICSLVIGQESVPLQNPTGGWKANYGFWVRVGCLGTIIGYCAGCQLGMWLDVPDLSSQQQLVFSGLMAVGIVAVGMAAAEIWVYPVPFFILSLSAIWPALLVGFTRFIVGAPVFKSFLSAAYPIYQILFNAVSHTSYELPVLLFLPAFKLVMKITLASATSHREDIMPEEVMFTTDFFDAFYLATFMPKLTWRTLVVLWVIHFMQTAFELQELHQRAQSKLPRLHEVAGIDTCDTKNDLLTALRSLCHHSDLLRSQVRNETQVYSPISHRLFPDGCKLLGKFGPPNIDNLLTNFNQVLPELEAIPRFANLERVKGDVPFTSIPSPSTGLQYPTGTRSKYELIDTSTIFQEALEVLFNVSF